MFICKWSGALSLLVAVFWRLLFNYDSWLEWWVWNIFLSALYVCTCWGRGTVYAKKKSSLVCVVLFKKRCWNIYFYAKSTKGIWECSNLVQWPNNQSQNNVCVFALQSVISLCYHKQPFAQHLHSKYCSVFKACRVRPLFALCKVFDHLWDL